ncbi:hypothetical protein CVV26_00490 [Candidatus Kuenenbacteria bacterium HGW-Kuenenbacteria-1]|uniref:Transposase IS200-like domain-containing protein n=1 Tax=Candidatus Kuenenbacteria bacterium HGW-Kuenenbacteria-1 TaxID=2013812 RepID=A0A2N1UPB7_9BACT|nr:MAG: hypothetical protein CVV26_00490 [Candidatus Kuenenbacteria bacterium HGW-Kuenenbacteria-1]
MPDTILCRVSRIITFRNKNNKMQFKNFPKFQEGIHFITTKTFRNYPYFKDEKNCLILLEELNFYRKKLDFKILGYVIMSDHLHFLIWWDIEKYPELTISKIMQGIKGHSAIKIRDYINITGRLEPLLQPKDESRGSHLPHKKGLKYKIWQSGFYDFNIISERKFLEKLNYIHNNPTKFGLCKNLEDYKWSSYRQFINLDKNLILKID